MPLFGKKNRSPLEAEIQKAVEERDELLAGVADAVANVDDLKDELLEEYKQANGVE